MKRDFSLRYDVKSVENFTQFREALGEITQQSLSTEVVSPELSRLQKFGNWVVGFVREVQDGLQTTPAPHDISHVSPDKWHDEADNGGLIIHYGKSWH